MDGWEHCVAVALHLLEKKWDKAADNLQDIVDDQRLLMVEIHIEFSFCQAI